MSMAAPKTGLNKSSLNTGAKNWSMSFWFRKSPKNRNKIKWKSQKNVDNTLDNTNKEGWY